MVERTAWIKLQWAFGLPIGMYPNVVERVRGTPARLEDLVRGLSSDILTPRDGDKWSIQEQAGHLFDLEELGMNRLDDFEAARDTLVAADMTNQKTHEANHNETLERSRSQRCLGSKARSFAIHQRLVIKKTGSVSQQDADELERSLR